MIQVIIDPNSKFTSNLGLEIAKGRRQNQSIMKRIFTPNSSPKTKLNNQNKSKVSSKRKCGLHQISSSYKKLDT